MKHAFLRLFLIFFPLLPLLLILNLSKNSLKGGENAASKAFPSFETQCPPFIGVSPLFSKQEIVKKNRLSRSQHLPYEFLISEINFLKQISSIQVYFKKNNVLSKNLLITLPLYLTKDLHWLVSKKSFIISQNLERKELSYLNYEDFKQSFLKIYKSKPLTLNTILRKYPTSSLLLKLEGKNDKKILEKLDFLTGHRGQILLLSSNEELLKQVSQRYPKVLLLHSFKKLIRFQLLNILQIKSFVNFPGDGILIPSSLSPSKKIISYIRSLKKLLIIEEEGSLGKISKTLAESINGLVSSNFQSSLKFIEHKKPCFLK